MSTSEEIVVCVTHGELALVEFEIYPSRASSAKNEKLIVRFFLSAPFK